jgi:hypothetical protein
MKQYKPSKYHLGGKKFASKEKIAAAVAALAESIEHNPST